MRPGRRHHRLRKLGRLAQKPSTQPEEIPLGIPVDSDDSALSEDSTLVEVGPVTVPTAGRAGKNPKPTKSATQDDTAEVQALKGKPVKPNPDSVGALDGDLVPDPPDKIGFTCACGVKLVARRKSYDKRMRCGSCRTLMLISVVYDPAGKKFDIEPFRVGDLPDLPL